MKIPLLKQIKPKRSWLFSLVLLAVLAVVILGHGLNRSATDSVATAQPAPTESPSPNSVNPAPPEVPDLPNTPATPVPTPNATPTVLPAPPQPTATPLPLSSNYQDPGGRFKVGILQGYQVSPLAGSVLVEAPDGSLSYTIVVQPQAFTTLVGNDAVLVNATLEQIARTVFQRGEGFQAGVAQPAAPEGIQMEWTGTLTIAGNPQPIGGVVLARRAGNDALLLLIAATQSGSAQVPGAIVALTNSLQAL
jgi:hypothetical protein